MVDEARILTQFCLDLKMTILSMNHQLSHYIPPFQFNPIPMVNPKGNTENILNFKKIMRKKKIHLVQKGPDQDIRPKIGSRKGYVQPKNG